MFTISHCIRSQAYLVIMSIKQKSSYASPMLGFEHSLRPFLENAEVGDRKVRALWGKGSESVPKR